MGSSLPLWKKLYSNSSVNCKLRPLIPPARHFLGIFLFLLKNVANVSGWGQVRECSLFLGSGGGGEMANGKVNIWNLLCALYVCEQICNCYEKVVQVSCKTSCSRETVNQNTNIVVEVSKNTKKRPSGLTVMISYDYCNGTNRVFLYPLFFTGLCVSVTEQYINIF